MEWLEVCAQLELEFEINDTLLNPTVEFENDIVLPVWFNVVFEAEYKTDISVTSP